MITRPDPDRPGATLTATNVVLAAIDNSAAARPVLAVARKLAPLWDATVIAIRVDENHDTVAGSAALASGVALRVEHGDAVGCVAGSAADDAVVAVVMGLRGRPGGPRPAGHVAMELITVCTKPVVVVPPDMQQHGNLQRIVVALEGSMDTSAALRPLLERARAHGVFATAVHVDDEHALPAFSDQPQYESAAFAEEFTARYAPVSAVGISGPTQLELRIGEPPEQVLAVCDQTEADLLVVAWSCNLAPGHARFVRTILADAKIPVMLVPVSTRRHSVTKDS